MDNFIRICATCLYQLVAIFDPRHSITFVIDYVMQSVCLIAQCFWEKAVFSTGGYLPLLQLLLRLLLLLLINVVRSFDLIQMMKNPTTNEACIRSTFSGLIQAKALIKHYAGWKLFILNNIFIHGKH